MLVIRMNTQRLSVLASQAYFVRGVCEFSHSSAGTSESPLGEARSQGPRPPLGPDSEAMADGDKLKLKSSQGEIFEVDPEAQRHPPSTQRMTGTARQRELGPLRGSARANAWEPHVL